MKFLLLLFAVLTSSAILLGACSNNDGKKKSDGGEEISAGDDDDSAASDDDATPEDDDDATPEDDDDATPEDDDDATPEDDDVSLPVDDDTTAISDDDSVPVTLALAIECDDQRDDIYVTPDSLPAYDSAKRGDVVRCSEGDIESAQSLAEHLRDIEGVAVTSGYASYRIAYRTERDPGVPGVATAVLYLPDNPISAKPPLVVANHGTAGLADSCAPSRYDQAADASSLKLPWVAAGFPVIAPDYAGLGNEGVQGYGNTLDTAHSVLDAARALLKAVNPGAVDNKVILVGHSQGGGASLNGMALVADYGAPDLELIAVIPIAGSYQKTSAAYAMFVPDYPISGGDGVTCMKVALMVYADFANLFGEARASEPFHPDLRDYLASSIQTLCVFQLADALAKSAQGYTPPNTLGELVDPAFREAVVACLTNQSCTAEADAYVARSAANIVPIAAPGVPVLLLGGENDVQNTPENQACLLKQLQDYGLTVQACQWSGQDHFTIVEAAIGYTLEWVKAVISGQEKECPLGPALPECPAN
jgi:pimeloyl-ACP methyl ester carboxylesterase